MLDGVADQSDSLHTRDQLRAADADRQRVADRLREAVGEGRLTMDEYDERVRETYQAKTYADLDRLLADLPGPARVEHSVVVPVPGDAVPRPERRGGFPRWLWAVWGGWVAAVTINVVIWALVSLSIGEWIYFWPMWVAGPWGAVLLFTTFSIVAGGESAKRRYETRDRDRDRRREQRREQRR